MKPEKKALWFVLLSSCLLLLLSRGYQTSFGLFVAPISETHQWGREVISFSFAIQSLCWGIFGLFGGGLADRFGNVRVVVGSVVLYASGMALITIASEPLPLYFTAVLVGAGIGGTSFGIILPAMARAVGEKNRSLVLGLGTAAGSLGQFIVVPFSQTFVDVFGWVSALHILSASALLMALLAIPLLPYSGKIEAQFSSTEDKSIIQTLKEAFCYYPFVLLIAGFFVCGFHVAFITVHLPVFLTDKGFDIQVGVLSIALIGLFNIAGSFLSGMLSGKFSKNYLLSCIYFSRALVIALFLFVPISLLSVVFFSIAMGLLWLATIPPTAGLVVAMFGSRYMALLYGVVFLGHQLGSFSGIWLGGWVYDRFQSYDSIWKIGITLAIIAGLLHLPIQEKKAYAVS